MFIRISLKINQTLYVWTCYSSNRVNFTHLVSPRRVVWNYNPKLTTLGIVYNGTTFNTAMCKIDGRPSFALVISKVTITYT